METGQQHTAPVSQAAIVLAVQEAADTAAPAPGWRWGVLH